MFVLWSGDILMLYGLMGLFLPGLARLQSTRRTIVMLALFAVPLATHVTVVMSKGALDPRPPFAATGAALRHHWGVKERGTLDLFARGSSADYFAWNTANAIVRPGTYLQSGRPAKVLALFLLGVWLGQAVLPSATTLQRALWLTLLIGAAVGLPTSFEYASIKAATRSTFLVSREGLVQTAAYTLGTTPLALAYLAGATLAWRTPSGRPWLEWFVPLGRMALTVYLTQSVLQLAIFSSHGLALAGRISIAWLPRVGEHSAVVWKRLYLRPPFANRSAVGVWHGPPNALDAPKPTSSSRITSTFGAPAGGRSRAIGGNFVSGSLAS
jgi:uncharacterized protein